MNGCPDKATEAMREDLKPNRESEGLAIFSSERIFAGTKEIGIEHDGSIYRLRITRQGKLILNK